MLREPDVPWQEVRERGVVLSHLTGPPDTFPGDTMCHEAGCQGNKEEAGTARDQLSVCGLAASLFSTREGEWGPFEGHGAWLPALSTSTLGAHSCPEEPAGHWHTRGRGAVPRTGPSPCKLAQEESLQDQNAFSPTVLLKSLYLEKTNKKTKHSPPNTPPAQTPGNLTIILRKNREPQTSLC